MRSWCLDQAQISIFAGMAFVQYPLSQSGIPQLYRPRLRLLLGVCRIVAELTEFRAPFLRLVRLI